MSAEPVRRLALQALVAVEEGAPLEACLDAALASLPDPRGRALLAELVKGSVRFQGRYDHLVRSFSRQPRRRLPPALRALLRLALHQLIGCGGVPAYAAVDQAVALCREAVSPRLAGYVNALLQAVARRLSAAGSCAADAILPFFPAPDREPAAFLSSYHSHPRWLAERWLRRYGAEGAAALCEHNNRPAPLTLHVLAPEPPAAAATRLRAGGLAVEPGTLVPRALRMVGGAGRDALAQLLAGERGLIVQDEGAQAATAWLAAGGSAGRWLDLCAAPGGKLFHLRALGAFAGPAVAMDVDALRVERLLATGKRIEGGAPLVVIADGEAPPFRDGTWAAVLVDGPCSGTGVLRHHPEGRWRLRPERLQASGARLRRLAAAAAALLAPGGRLLYATCSLEPEENEDVVAALLAAGLDLEPDPHPAPEEQGVWQRYWLPQETLTDGFFAARLRRREVRA